MNKWLLLLLIVVLLGGGVLAFRALGEKNETNSEDDLLSNTTMNTNTLNLNTNTSSAAAEAQKAKLAAKPVATMETSLGTITMQFYTTDAPELTKNFIELAKSGYYDGLTFHRIVPGFVIQGGDPNGDGTGGHSYKGEGQGLADEPGALALKHYAGAVAWAKSSLPNSIGSQFYIALDNLTQLDGAYSVFGQVVTGMDVVEKIAAVQTDSSSKPLTPVTITKVTITE